MKIKSIYIRRFRSIQSTAVEQCGELNVFIGKNNAGKSNILSTIDLMLGHLRMGSVAGPWHTKRHRDQFTDRQISRPMQIGIEFDLPSDFNEELRIYLKNDAPHLERSIEQIKTQNSIAFILAGVWKETGSFLFLEQIGVGSIRPIGEDITIDGIPLLSVSVPVGAELYSIYQEGADLRSESRVLDTISKARGQLEFAFREDRIGQARVMLNSLISGILDSPRSTSIVRTSIPVPIRKLIDSPTTLDDFIAGLEGLIADNRTKIESLDQRQTIGSIKTFAGENKTPPTYATWLMKQYGELPILPLTETRPPIGRDEAEALLQLKVKRGGPDRLRAVQQIVQALLGVNIDAFEAEGVREIARLAEMDIDDFLAEANGAGIREALRLVLDLELKNPKLVLTEEPEVHLHPGLEQAVHDYLQEKSRDVQMFVTTHSTNFVDSVSFQNVYMVSRDENRKTICEKIDENDALLRIPAELGLRLSTVFMYDKLVFVEGPSDEEILREFARSLNIDTGRANVGFVYMRGVRNFAHFAAEGTLDLLTRRKIKMWFITDRDERDDSEVAKMLNSLGDRAQLRVLKRRELENYLLVPEAVTNFIVEKQAAAGIQDPKPRVEDVKTAIIEEASRLKEEVIRLRLERQIVHV